MPKFNDAVYSALVSDLINDAFYLEGISKRGVIAKIRQYAEVIVRRLLDLPPEEAVTLGNNKIKADLQSATKNNPLFLYSLEKIRVIGNKCTHTQEVSEIEDDDVNDCIDCLFKIYSYLFINYFEKHKFGSNSEVMSLFSILPPIIRHTTLSYLHEKDEDNISIIDKLALATLKAFSKEEAMVWLDSKKDKLSNMPSITEDGYREISKQYGPEVAKSILANAPNMYNLCAERISKVAATIDEYGKLYNDFESAMEIYETRGTLGGNSIEAIEFNSLMDFVYLGRRAIKNERLDNIDRYTSLQ